MRAMSLALIVLQLNFASIAVAQQYTGDNNLFDAVKEKIISAIVAGVDSYSICEHVDRANKPSYVARLIPASEMPASDDAIIARYFVVRKNTDPISVDFALYRVQFTSNRAAMRAVSYIRTGKTGTVADGEVLTRYAVQLDGNSIYIIQTRSLLDPSVRSFLDSFAREEIKIR